MSIGVEQRVQFDALVRSANSILVLTSKDPSNDSLAALVTLVRLFRTWGKSSFGFVSSGLPKAQHLVDLSVLRNNIDDYRDFIIDIDLAEDQTIKLLSNTVEKNTQQFVLRSSGNQITSSDIKTRLGSFNFDLVVTVGVSSLSKIDSVIASNADILDGLHLINIDHHFNNELFGSLNIVDSHQISTTQVLFNLVLGYGTTAITPIDATAMYSGILANTNRFSSPNTTAKVFRDASYLVELGANTTDASHCLFGDLEKFIAKRGEQKIANPETTSYEIKKEDNVDTENRANMPTPLPIKEIIDKQFESKASISKKPVLADFAKPRPLQTAFTSNGVKVQPTNVSQYQTTSNFSRDTRVKQPGGQYVQTAQNMVNRPQDINNLSTDIGAQQSLAQPQNTSKSQAYQQPPFYIKPPNAISTNQVMTQQPISQRSTTPIYVPPKPIIATTNPYIVKQSSAPFYDSRPSASVPIYQSPQPIISNSINDRPIPPTTPIHQWQKLSSIINTKLSNNPLNKLQQMQNASIPVKKKSLAEELLEIDKNNNSTIYGQY